MNREKAAQGFSAMGSEARLVVLQCLIRAGDGGLTVGAIQDRTGIVPSTLAHHLKTLVQAGVIEQERAGRSTISRARFDHLAELADFILSECCSDQQQKVANHG